jgi:hypothetical protein
VTGASSPGPETSIKAHRKVNKRERVLSESELDDEEQEAKKSKGKKKIHYSRESDSDDKETDDEQDAKKCKRKKQKT